MTIHVTQAHIDAGERAVCSACPIALALGKPYLVGAEWIYRRVAPFKLERAAKLPCAAWDFIAAFDRSQPVQPFSFEVEIPVEVEK